MDAGESKLEIIQTKAMVMGGSNRQRTKPTHNKRFTVRGGAQRKPKSMENSRATDASELKGQLQQNEED
jgi:hypothetical protein